MTRRETLALLAQIGIKPIEQCDAQLCDYCVWSSFRRNIGRRLTNNERHVHDDDIYVRNADKERIVKFYENEQKTVKKMQANPRGYLGGGRNRVFRLDVIVFIA